MTTTEEWRKTMSNQPITVNCPEALREGSPVLARTTPCFCKEEWDGSDKIFVGKIGEGGGGRVMTKHIFLNLSNPTGLSHAIWALAGRTNVLGKITRDFRQNGLIKVWIGDKVEYVSKATRLHPHAKVVPGLADAWYGEERYSLAKAVKIIVEFNRSQQ